MPRIDLLVPFAEKDEAKQLGARWDSNKKIWFAPDGLDPKSFQKWIPEEVGASIRSSHYFIAESSQSCWKCEQTTRVHGFMLPAGHETLEEADAAEAGFGEDDEFDDADFQAWLDSPAAFEWTLSDYPAIVHYVTSLPATVVSRMQTRSQHYRLDFSHTTQSFYWMNHCEHCGMKQGDFQMYQEPQGAFCPINESDAAKIILHSIAEPFESNGSYCCDDDLIEFMQRA